MSAEPLNPRDRVVAGPTLGERGALLAAPGGMEVVPPFAVSATDTTGAGDAFVGSFAVFLAEGCSEREAVRRANLYAALSTTGIGTQRSFVARDVFDAEWRRCGWGKVLS